MAVRDLLWACPPCGIEGRLDREGRCSACGTRFVRGKGARITARRPDGSEETRPAGDWADQLPAPESLLPEEAGALVRTASVLASRVSGTRPVHGETGYLNRIEIAGPSSPAELRLFGDRVELEGESGEDAWRLEELTAIQASSSSLQLKPRGAPLVSFRFDDDSVLLWESLLRAAVQAHYRRIGRGTIVEFQPRIVTAGDRS